MRGARAALVGVDAVLAGELDPGNDRLPLDPRRTVTKHGDREQQRGASPMQSVHVVSSPRSFARWSVVASTTASSHVSGQRVFAATRESPADGVCYSYVVVFTGSALADDLGRAVPDLVPETAPHLTVMGMSAPRTGWVAPEVGNAARGQCPNQAANLGVSGQPPES